MSWANHVGTGRTGEGGDQPPPNVNSGFMTNQETITESVSLTPNSASETISETVQVTVV